MTAESQRAYRNRLRGGPPRPLQPHGTRAAIRRHERRRITCPTCDGAGHLGPATRSVQSDYGRACPTCEGAGEMREPLCEPCRLERNRLARTYHQQRKAAP